MTDIVAPSPIDLAPLSSAYLRNEADCVRDALKQARLETYLPGIDAVAIDGPEKWLGPLVLISPMVLYAPSSVPMTIQSAMPERTVTIDIEAAGRNASLLAQGSAKHPLNPKSNS